MKLAKLFSELTAAFKKFDDPKLEARHLLMAALNIGLNELVLHSDAEVSVADYVKVEMWRIERLKGMPLAYLSGRKFFYKSEFVVRPGVLIPRPETEFVVETALRRAAGSRWIADLGCGSGCIGLSLLKEIPEARLVAVDSSPAAVEVTRENAVKLGLAERTEILSSAVEHWIPGRTFDLIVGNPPYIVRGDPRVQSSVHQFEPHEALYAADEGLGSLHSWIQSSWEHLRAGGASVHEFGSGQTASVRAIMQEAGFREIQITRDLNGIERVISGIKPE